jgi:hypothetical protein
LIEGVRVDAEQTNNNFLPTSQYQTNNDTFVKNEKCVGVDCNVSFTLLTKEKKSQRNYIGQVPHCLEK